MDRDLAVDTEVQGLGGDLAVAMQKQRVDLADRMLGGWSAIGRLDDERLAAPAD